MVFKNIMTPEQKQLKKHYMDIFNTDAGQAVLKDLQSRCFKYATTNTSPVASINDNNEGMRQVLLHIETMMSPEGMEAQGASNTQTEV